MVYPTFCKIVLELKLMMFVNIFYLQMIKKFNWIWHVKARINNFMSVRGFYELPTITC